MGVGSGSRSQDDHWLEIRYRAARRDVLCAWIPPAGGDLFARVAHLVITRAEAMAAGAPREPSIEYGPPTQALVNDSALTRRVSAALVKALGAARVKDTPPEMASEDFAEFHLAGVPTLMLRIGAVEQGKYDAAMKSGTPLPSLHSALFAPDREPTIKSAMVAEVLALRELMPVSPRAGN